MKRILSALFLLSLTVLSAHSQENLLKNKWHRFYIGGNNGYYVKTTQFSQTTMTEDQFGGGDTFDNSPMEVKVVEIYTIGDETRVITENVEAGFYILVFKNFTEHKAQGCISVSGYNTIEEAKTFMPADKDFTDWFTEDGYNAEMAKPVMPEMTKDDAVSFITYFIIAFKEIEKSAKEDGSYNKEMNGFVAAMLMAVVPSKYAGSKGYNAYKSLEVISRGMEKYKDDPAVKNILKEAGLPDM